MQIQRTGFEYCLDRYKEILDKRLSQFPQEPNMPNIPVIVLKMPQAGDQDVKVVEIMIGMEYFPGNSNKKILARDVFPENARLSSESCYCEK